MLICNVRTLVAIFAFAFSSSFAAVPDEIIVHPGKENFAIFKTPPPHKKIPEAYLIGCPEVARLWEDVKEIPVSADDYDQIIAKYEVFNIACSGPETPPKFLSDGEPGSFLLTSRRTGQRQRNYLNPFSAFHDAVAGGPAAKVSKSDYEKAYPNRGVDFDAKGRVPWCFFYMYTDINFGEAKVNGFAKNEQDAKKQMQDMWDSDRSNPKIYLHLIEAPATGTCSRLSWWRPSVFRPGDRR